MVILKILNFNLVSRSFMYFEMTYLLGIDSLKVTIKVLVKFRQPTISELLSVICYAPYEI